MVNEGYSVQSPQGSRIGLESPALGISSNLTIRARDGLQIGPHEVLVGLVWRPEPCVVQIKAGTSRPNGLPYI
jgi:hypothetical protein